MYDTEIGLQLIEMYRLIVHVYQKQFTDLLEHCGMTQMEMDILLFFANHPQYDTAADLIKIRALSKSHVSSAIDRLVNKGYLQRVYQKGNRKVIHLKLLPSAQTLVESGQSCQAQFATLLCRDIATDDLRIAAAVMHAIISNAQSALNETKER